MSDKTTTTKWVLSDAQDLINAMSAKVKNFGYSVTLGGSVLTKGESKNDIDLFFIPTGDRQAFPIDMLMWLASKFGPGKTITAVPNPNGRLAPPPRGILMAPDTMKHKMSFDLQGRKIEVFVI